MRLFVVQVCLVLCFSQVATAQSPKSSADDATSTRVVTKVLSVADIVVDRSGPGILLAKDSRRRSPEKLIETITKTIAPATWASAGGSNKIEYYPLGLAIVITAPGQVIAEIEDLLENIRVSEERPLVFDCRLLELWGESVQAFWPQSAKPESTEKRAPLVLDRHDFASTWNKITKIDFITKSYFNAGSVELPTVKSANTQSTSIRIGEVEEFVTGVDLRLIDGNKRVVPKTVRQQMGISLKMKPVLSLDTKSIQLQIDAVFCELGQFPIQGKTVKLEDGSTHVVKSPQFVTRSVKTTVGAKLDKTVILYMGRATVQAEPQFERNSKADDKDESTNHLVLAIDVQREPSPSELKTRRLNESMQKFEFYLLVGDAEKAREAALECILIDPLCFQRKTQGK